MAERQAFISLKNHKENFENNPKPNNSRLHSKQVLNRIRSKTNSNQWRNTKSVIDWFSNIREKKKHSFLIFDTVDFYLSISEHLLKLSLTYAMQFTTVSDEDIEINTHSRKTLLFDKNETWIKRCLPHVQCPNGLLWWSGGLRIGWAFYPEQTLIRIPKWQHWLVQGWRIYLCFYIYIFICIIVCL